jgi:hypothetical protein
MDGGPATEWPTAKKSKKRTSWPPEVSACPFARLSVDGLSVTCCTCKTRDNCALARCQYAHGLTQWHRHLASKSHEDATNNAEHEKKTAKKKKKPVSKQVAMLEHFEREPKRSRHRVCKLHPSTGKLKFLPLSDAHARDSQRINHLCRQHFEATKTIVSQIRVAAVSSKHCRGGGAHIGVATLLRHWRVLAEK